MPRASQAQLFTGAAQPQQQPQQQSAPAPPPQQQQQQQAPEPVVQMVQSEGIPATCGSFAMEPYEPPAKAPRPLQRPTILESDLKEFQDNADQINELSRGDLIGQQIEAARSQASSVQYPSPLRLPSGACPEAFQMCWRVHSTGRLCAAQH